MGKKSKARFPKRVAGVRVPKRVRRFADSPVGSAIIAEGIIHGATAVVRNPRVRASANEFRLEAEDAGTAGFRFMGNVVRTALMPVVAAAHDIVDQAEAYRRRHDRQISVASDGGGGGKKKKKKPKKKQQEVEAHLDSASASM